jgi:hypothetical protein
MRQLIILVLPALLFLQTATASSLYKWVDENGNIVYSQTMPPPGAKVLQQPRIRGLRTPPPPAESDNAPQQAQPATSTISASSEAEPSRNLTEDQQEQYREYCQNLSKNLELLKQPKRVYVGTEDGGRHYLSDEEREEKIRSTNEKITKHCQEK